MEQTQEKHYQDIFYDTRNLDLETKERLLYRAKEKSNEWKTDLLDCRVSWQRKLINLNFEEIMKAFDDSCHFVVIYRRGPEKAKGSYILDWWYGEIGFSTMESDANYFLFIYLNEEKLEEICEEFGLQPM